MIKLYVGGFPLEMDELKLVEMVSLYGQVVTIKIVRDRQTKKSKGYAFIEMTDRENAENVIIALDGSMIGERVLSINIAEEKAPAPAGRYGGSKPSYNKPFTPRPSGSGNSRPGGGGGNSGGGTGDQRTKRPRRQA